MKKLAILFLLTIVVSTFTFAIEGIGDFTAGLEISVDNITSAGKSVKKGGDVGYESGADPYIGFEPSIAYSRSFGAFGIAAKLGTFLGFQTGDSASYWTNSTTKARWPGKGGSNFYNKVYIEVTPSYALEAGPGTLGFALTIKPVFYTYVYDVDYPGPDYIFNPSISYTGIDVGFGTLGFALFTDDLKYGYNADDDGEGYDWVIQDIAFKATLALPFGLTVWVSPRVNIEVNDSQPHNSLNSIRADATYTLNETVNFGLEGRVPVGYQKEVYTWKGKGLFLKPHVNLTFGSIGAYAAVEISQIGAGEIEKKDKNGDVKVKAIVGGTYSF
jgi:hypothetical protein